MWEALVSPRAVYERRATWREIERDLESLVVYGRRVDQGFTLWRAVAQVSFGGGLFAVPVVAIALANGATAVAITTPAVLVVLCATALWMMGRLMERRVETHRAAVLLGWGRCVARDVPIDREWSVRLDLRRTGSAFFESARKNAFKELTRDPVTLIEYRQEWLDVAGRLRNGVRFRVTVSQRIKSREQLARKGPKVRERFLERATVTISGRRGEPAPSGDKAPAIAKRMLHKRSTLVARRLVEGDLHAGVVVRQLRAQRRGETRNPNAEYQLVDQHVLLRLFVAGYRARRLAQRRAMR